MIILAKCICIEIQLTHRVQFIFVLKLITLITAHAKKYEKFPKINVIYDQGWEK